MYPDDPGVTYDSDNPVRNDVYCKRRLDRILLRSTGWIPEEAQILGNNEIDPQKPNLRPSDHYGVSVTINQIK